MTTVLALDLAAETTGWVVLGQGGVQAALPAQQALGSTWRGVPAWRAWGCLVTGISRKTVKREKENRAAFNLRRYEAFSSHLRMLLTVHQPDVVAYEYPDRPQRAWGRQEQGSAGREFNAMRGLALAEGFLLAYLSQRAAQVDAPTLAVYGIPVRQAKWDVTHNPDASKEVVRHYLALNHSAPVDQMTLDESDACAVGLSRLLLHLGLQQPVPERPKRTMAC